VITESSTYSPVPSRDCVGAASPNRGQRQEGEERDGFRLGLPGGRWSRWARGPATYANERIPSLHHRVGPPPAGRSTRFPCAITSPPVPCVLRVAGCPHEGPTSCTVPRAAIRRGTLRHELTMTTRGFFVCSRLVTLAEPGFLQNYHALRHEMDDGSRAAARYGSEKVRANYSRKVMVEGKGFNLRRPRSQ
jgi:hypothetical protein